MKKVLILVIGLTLPWVASAQGIFNGNALNQVFEYNGSVVSSTTVGQWYIGSAGITDDNLLSPVSTAKPFEFDGYFLPDSIATSFAAGSTITVELRAWHANAGADWTTQLANSSGFSGKSALYQVSELAKGINPPPSVSNFSSFTLAPNSVPEPSTIALGVMGLSVLLFRRRK